MNGGQSQQDRMVLAADRDAQAWSNPAPDFDLSGAGPVSAPVTYRGWTISNGTGCGPLLYATHPDFDGESLGLQVYADGLADLYLEVNHAIEELAA